jgi:outer membrane protein assembly factor BamB
MLKALSMKQKLTVLILFTAFVVTGCSSLFRGPTCDQPEHNFAGNSSLRLLWSKSNVYVPNTGFHPLIQGLAPYVFVVSMPKNGESLITAFDDVTGALLWQRTDKLGIGILVGGKSLYVGGLDTINQHDPATGKLIEELVSLQRVYDPTLFTEYPHYGDVGLIDPMYYADNKIFAFAPGSRRSLSFDVVTKTLGLSRALLPYTPFVVANDVFYLSDFEGFKAEDANTQKVLWKYPINVSMNPLFTDKVIIAPTLSDNIYILSKATGELIAKVYAQPISNVAEDATRIYFLTKDGDLEVVGITTGQVIQKISLSATPFSLSTSQKTIGSYDLWVDPQNEIVVASLGDSCQLVALKMDIP